MMNNGTPSPSATRSHPPADISSYLDRFRGRTPSEMLGLPKKSGLPGSFILASLITGAVFILLTLVPYSLSKPEGLIPDSASSATPSPTASTSPANAAPTTSDQSTTTPQSSAAMTTPPAPTSKPPDITKKLGEADVKVASPKVNPLDKPDDDLLKILDK